MEVRQIDEAKQTAFNSMSELISNTTQSLDEEQVLNRVSQFEKAFCFDCQGDKLKPFVMAFQLFSDHADLDSSGMPDEFDIVNVAERRKINRHVLCNLLHHAKQLEIYEDISSDINNNEFTVGSRINRLIDSYDDAYETVFRHIRQFERINFPTVVHVTPESDNTYRNSTLDTEDITPYQNLLLSLLKKTYELNYRRYKDQCCEQIKTPEGYPTRAWKPVMSISSFVYDVAQKEINGDTWKHLTQKASNARDAARHLTECIDMQFLELKKERNIWSFNNGILYGKKLNAKSGRYECKFYPYDVPTRDLDGIVSSKYFNKNLNTYDNIPDHEWYDIPTPVFQGILDYQKFDIDVCKWLYVMGGKMCFDVGDIDGWQVIPFLKGVAMSGKSTIITKVFKKFYESEDVRTLSNNIERKFGLSSIYDGFMFIAPEVKGDMCLEQAEFQSLVSGEDVSLARKYEKAKSIEWKTPGILAGNEVPNWKDNSGSVLRRILPWSFNRKVMDADPHLDEKLDREIPTIMYKCIKAYLDYAQKYADQDIWNVVPSYFKKVQEQVAMITNSLQHFLASEKIKYGKELYCPQKDFYNKFNLHCQENNLTKCKFNPDVYLGPFSSRGIEVRVENVTYENRPLINQPIIFGLDLVDDEAHISFSNDR